MKKNNKIVLLFPDGVGIRNYFYSDVFKGMEKQLVLFHAFDAKTEQAVKDITSIENSISIPKYSESLKEKFLRELICLARLKHNAKLVNNPSIFGKNIKQIKSLIEKEFVISRVLHSDSKLLEVPQMDTILHENDKLLIVSNLINIEIIETVIGIRIDMNR